VTRRSAVDRILSLYPRAWRDRYGDELRDLTNELTMQGEFSSFRLVFGLLASALVQRVRVFRLTWRSLLVAGTTLSLILTAVIVADGAPSSRLPRPPRVVQTKGTIPPPTNGTIETTTIPDFISVTGDGKIVGYAPRDYLFPSAGSDQNNLVGGVVPVYGPDLKTLVGHMYPGIGWVPIGGSPASGPCQQVFAVENGTTTTLPCPSTTIVVPNVVGMPTPDGVGALQKAGLGILVQNGVSSTVPPGHIVRSSPAAGANGYGREVITVTNSLGPGSP
jgi:hypothetical protein